MVDLNGKDIYIDILFALYINSYLDIEKRTKASSTGISSKLITHAYSELKRRIRIRKAISVQ